MDDHRRYHHLSADPTTAIAYARIADRHAAAERRHQRDPDDPRIHSGPGPLTGVLDRLRVWWHRPPTGVIAAQVEKRAKKSGRAGGSDLPSLLRC